MTMKDKRQYLVYFTFLILLLVSLVGCSAGTSPEQSIRQKAPLLPEKKYAENRKQTEKGKGQLSDNIFFVTDHRTNSPTIREYTYKKQFLREYGFDSQEPYFEYATDDGTLQLELYYNTSSGVGCGLRYYPEADRKPEGFLFNGSNNYRYYRDFMEDVRTGAGQYAILSFDGEDGSDKTLQESPDCEHCYVSHGNVEYYYIYADEDEIPAYCLIIDNNSDMLCAELLEYYVADSDMYYGLIGPTLAGEAENRYAAAVREMVEADGRDYGNYVTHTYAADYDGDGMEEAFVIFGIETNNKYAHDISGRCWFVDSNLNVSLCLDEPSFDLKCEFICQDGKIYLLLAYTIGNPWRAGIYTVQDNVPVEISGSTADKYIDRQGQVIQIQDAYDGTCEWSTKYQEYFWSGHSLKPYTFLFDHGTLLEVPAREVTKEEVEQIAPLPDSFDERAPESVKQFILRDNGELNINMAKKKKNELWDNYYFSYITYKLNEDGEWEYVEWQQGRYSIQFGAKSSWDYVDELLQRQN